MIEFQNDLNSHPNKPYRVVVYLFEGEYQVMMRKINPISLSSLEGAYNILKACSKK